MGGIGISYDDDDDDDGMGWMMVCGGQGCFVRSDCRGGDGVV